MKIYLDTTRMILREFTDLDVDNLFELDSDPEVTRFINGGKPTPRDYIKEKIIPHILAYYGNDDGQGIWAAINKADNAFMGWFHLRPNRVDLSETELGYRFKQKYWGQGYATEGSRALISQGFNVLNVETIVAIADPANGASRRVMEKAGLHYDSTYKEQDDFSVVKYRLNKDDFLL